MSIISVLNLKEIETWEDYLFLLNLNMFVICAKEKKNVKKI